MIIFGWRTRESTTGSGTFVCPHCRTPQVSRHVTYRRWFTLYFLPVIPLGQLGEQLECQGCLCRFSPQVFERSAEDEPIVAALADDRNGTRSSPAAPPWHEVSGAEGGKPGSAPLLPRAPRTSSLAITSLISGLLSPLFLFLCGLSLVTSSIAIITGHLARREIKTSGGRVGGSGQALTGLVFGYLLLAVSVGGVAFIATSFRRGWEQAKEDRTNGSASTLDGRARPSADTASDRLHAAELGTLTAGSEGPAFGNTPAARQLAAEYSQSLKTMREALFTADRDRVFQLTDGQFIVHCELHRDRCAFIVHVPAYRDFAAEAKEALATIAWQVAQQTVEDSLRPGDQLAVGLRGSMLYGAVMMGRVASDEEQRAAFQRVERDSLVAFFPAAERDIDSAGESAEQQFAQDSWPKPDPRQTAAPLASTEAEPTPDPMKDETGTTTKDRVLELEETHGMLPSRSPLSSAPPGEEPAAAVAETNLRPPRGMTREPVGVPAVENELEIQVVHRFPELGWQVQSLAFSADSRWLAAGKMDQTILIFDLETGSRIAGATDLGELGQIECVAFAPDGEHLFAGGSSGATQVWPFQPGGQLGAAVALYRHARSARVLSPSMASPFVLSGAADGTLTWQTYDRETASVRTLKALDRSVLAVHLPAAEFDALATDGRTLLRFDLRAAEVLQSQPIARASAHAAAFSNDGGQLVISTGRELCMWDTATGRQIQTLAQEAGEIQWSVRFHPGGRWLISGGRGKASVWDLETARSLATIDLGGVLYIQTLAISPDGRLLAAIPSAAGQTLTVLRLPDTAGST